jgi:DNA-directed RNA polymerase specialized sigma24 family protein
MKNHTTDTPSFTRGQTKEILTKRLLALPDYERNPHITHDIYGLPVAQTAKVVVVSAFTGVGKTRQL